MKLHVRHVTRYAFEAPVRQLVQVQRLWPADFAGQAVLSWSVVTDGAVTGARHVDAAGDRCETVSVRGPVDEVAVTVEGVVETTDTAGVLRDHRERIRPSAYLRRTRRTRADAALRALADKTLAPLDGAGELDRAHALSAAVSEAIDYAPGETRAHTTAAEALAGGKGVCQDHAHAMIALSLCADLPARYVTGYLLADDEGCPHEASHAWAEVHVDGLGWVGFDPANRCCPDDRYIRLGSGLDAQDAAPIRGLVQGMTAEETLTVEVTVTAGQQQQQQQG